MSGQKIYGKSLCLPFNFAVNVKLQVIKSFLKITTKRNKQKNSRRCFEVV